jgi:hypothetical protein
MHINVSPAIAEDAAGLAKVYTGSFQPSSFALSLYPGVHRGDARAIEFLDSLTQARIGSAISNPSNRVMKAMDTDTPDNKVIGLCLWASPQDWAEGKAKDTSDIERLIPKAPNGIDQEIISHHFTEMEVKLKLHMNGKRFWCKYL